VRAPLAPTLALVVLVAFAVASPWPFGSVEPAAVQVLSIAGLATALLVLLLGLASGGTEVPAVPLAPPAAFGGLVLVQLLPLPPGVHRLLAPVSHAAWHPADPVAAAVLGDGSRPLSLDPDTTVRGLGLLVGLLLLALLAAPALRSRRAAQAAVAVLVAGGFLVSAYGMWARTRFDRLLFGVYPVPTVSPFGPFVSKNHFAGYVALAALLALGLALGLAGRRGGRGDWTTGPRAGGVVLAVVAAAGMALGVLASFSRGGAMALLAGLLTLAALALGLRRPSLRLLPALAVAAALAGALFAVLPSEAHDRLRSAEGASFRLGVWRDALRLAGGSPLVGTGLGSFHDAFPPHKRGHGLIRVTHAENDYLEVLVETGGLGLGLVLAGAGLLAAGAWRGLRGAEPLPRGLGLGALAGLAAAAAHSGVDFVLRIPSNAALAAALVAVSAALAGPRPRPLGRRGSLVLAGLVALLGGALLALPASPSALARERVREAALAATPEARALRLDRAEDALRRALAWRPAHAEAWLQLAAVRRARGDDASAIALARHAVALDPQRPDLRRSAEDVAGPIP